MTCEVKVIAHSISPAGKQICTISAKYWRAIHAEVMTHRVFSRNASSSRAIPVAKMIEQVRNDPAGPIHWGANRSGMQAHEELTGFELEEAKALWRQAANFAANIAEQMRGVGLHKQVANRILEPYQYIHVVITATEWENFFELRDHKDAQPEIKELAQAMKEAMLASVPVRRPAFGIGAWHLPYVTVEERKRFANDPKLLCAISTARCARVSYLKHDGTAPSIEDDLELFDMLVGARPLHASPTEHQAKAISDGDWRSGNLQGWLQNRKIIESSHLIP